MLPLTDQVQSPWDRIAAGRLKASRLSAKPAVEIGEKLVLLPDCICRMFIPCLAT
jgi:hypothetical protein